MDQKPQNPTPEPVAYDKDGNPLYAHPPVQQSDQQTGPQVVYMARPVEPQQPVISEKVQKRAEESKARFPHLNLSPGEFVISAIRRHPIGLFSIWAVVGIAILGLIVGIVVVLNNSAFSGLGGDSTQWLAFIFLLLAALVFLGGVIATIVYEANRFYLTNESVIQHIQVSLFSKKEQTISLANIEDASFRQHGIIQHIFGYGSLRLSTEGDETTYRFNYVANPHKQVQLLNDAVEAFKNGRPFEPNDD